MLGDNSYTTFQSKEIEKKRQSSVHQVKPRYQKKTSSTSSSKIAKQSAPELPKAIPAIPIASSKIVKQNAELPKAIPVNPEIGPMVNTFEIKTGEMKKSAIEIDMESSSTSSYFADKFDCSPLNTEIFVPFDATHKKSGQIFPIGTLDLFKIDIIEKRIKKVLYSVVGLDRLYFQATEEEYLQMIKYIRQYCPLFTMTNFNSHPESLYVNADLFRYNHVDERRQYADSIKLRAVEKPDIVHEYNLNACDYYNSVNASQSSDVPPEEVMRSFMRSESSWVYMPDPKLLRVSFFESAAAGVLLDQEEKFLDDINIINALVSTPSYLTVFSHYKNMHKLNAGKCFPNYSILNHLVYVENIFVAEKNTITENHPFVLRMDNPLCCMTQVTPELQDRILSFVTFGISDMIPYHKGAFLSGSMISATIQFILNRDLFLLDSNYPRIYTKPQYGYGETIENVYVRLRACLYALAMQNAKMEAVEIFEDYSTVKFTFTPRKDKTSNPFDACMSEGWRTTNSAVIFNNRYVAEFNEDVKKLACKYIEDCETNPSFTFSFKNSAGCDIDVPVDCKDPENVKYVAVDMLTKMSAKWPGAYLKVITKNRKNPMYRISTDSMEDRIAGFRDVEVFPAKDPRSQIASYHVNAVRAWKGALPGIYLTASSVLGHSSMETTQHRYFAGKDKPWTVLDKYRTRGFSTYHMRGYDAIRKKIVHKHPKEDYNYVSCNSAYGLVGDFNIFSHFFNVINPAETVDVEAISFEKKHFEYDMTLMPEWETHIQRRKRLNGFNSK